MGQHTWRFHRAASIRSGSYHGKDLLALDQLDQKLWVALSRERRDVT